jgi:gamma-glutamyl-gamma-aminobutyrate hydrolase PuuD
MEQEEDDLPVFGDNLMELMNTNGKYPMAIEDLSDDEKEDYYIKDTDAIIVAGKIVCLLSFRKKNTRVLKSMSMNKRETISMSITKSCFPPSP